VKKTFRVEIFVGHRVVSLPFGRFDVSEDGLTVRARPAWMLKSRTAPRDTIRRVTVKHRWQAKVITIDDTDGVFDKMNLNALVMGYGKLQAQLERCGYAVVDRR
jgi:hypothetical protein